MAMEYRRTLELNIISAEDLKDVNQFTTMDVYAVVSVFADPLHPHTATTHVDKDGGTNPTWNYPVKFTVNESLVQQNRLSLEVKLISDRILAGDTVIGNVHIPLKVLLDNPAAGDSLRQVSYKVIKPSGKAKGTLNFSYKFGKRVVAYPPPGTADRSSSVPHGTAYPPPQHAAGYAYPQPQTAYGGYPPAQPGYGYPPQPGYGYPPQQGSGYPPPQQGYGHPAGQKPPKKKNKLGMGLGVGVGLVGDALAVGVGLVGDALSVGGLVGDALSVGGLVGDALNVGGLVEQMGSVVGTSDAGYEADNYAGFDGARSDF